MLYKSPFSAFGTLFLWVICFDSLALAVFNQGSVSFWSSSDCAQGDSLIVQNYTLSADTCGNLPRAVHSYRVDHRPACSDGTTAAFAYFAGQVCESEGYGSAFDNVLDTDDTDGECLALVDFYSVAFICQGLDGDVDGCDAEATDGCDDYINEYDDSCDDDYGEECDGDENVYPCDDEDVDGCVNVTTVSQPQLSAAISTGFPTPYDTTVVATTTSTPPSFSAPTSSYTLLSTSVTSPAPPIGTQPPSGALPSKTGVVSSPVPSPFTGAASEVKASVMGGMLALGLGLLV